MLTLVCGSAPHPQPFSPGVPGEKGAEICCVGSLGGGGGVYAGGRADAASAG